MNELLERIGFNRLTYLPKYTAGTVIPRYRRGYFLNDLYNQIRMHYNITSDFTDRFYDFFSGQIFYSLDVFWDTANSNNVDFGKIYGNFDPEEWPYRYCSSTIARLGLVNNKKKTYHIRGSFVKRLSTLFMACFSIPLVESLKTWIGNNAYRYTGIAPDLLFDIAPFIGWQAGTFQEKTNSCWWPKVDSSLYADYALGRLLFESMMPQYGFAIRFFEPISTNTTNPYGLETYGRMMAIYNMPDLRENEFVVFNAYSKYNKTQARDFATSLSAFLGYPSPTQVVATFAGRFKDLRGTSYDKRRDFYNINTRPYVFFNGDSAYLISPYEDRPTTTFEWSSPLSNEDLIGVRENYLRRDYGNLSYIPEWWTDTLTGESYSSHDGIWRVVYDRPPKNKEDVPSFNLRHFNHIMEVDNTSEQYLLPGTTDVVYVSNVEMAH